MSIFFYCWILVFQSTLPHGSDLNNELTKAKIKTISIHAPSRERRQTLFDDNIVTNISIRAPSRERLKFSNWLILQWDFNPRSLTGATEKSHIMSTDLKISIHAPSRERPFLNFSFSSFTDISIHAPSRERQQCVADQIGLL